MTVLGGMIELSAIFAQSLIIVNFPCGSKKPDAYVRSAEDEREGDAFHNHTVLPDLHMIANSRSFYDGICTDVNIVTDLHRVIVECTAIRLVRRPRRAKR